MIQYSQSMQGQCEMIIEGENGSEQRVALAGSRYNNRESNKFHINLPMDNHPSRITVNCTDGDLNVSMLDSIETPRNPAVNDLVGPMFIGQEHGYKVFESTLAPVGLHTLKASTQQHWTLVKKRDSQQCELVTKIHMFVVSQWL